MVVITVASSIGMDAIKTPKKSPDPLDSTSIRYTPTFKLAPKIDTCKDGLLRLRLLPVPGVPTNAVVANREVLYMMQ